MADLPAILHLLQSLSDAEKRIVLTRLRQMVPPHPMELRLKTTAESLLEAIARASALTIRGIEGIIAEATFATEVLPELSRWKEIKVEGNNSFDFLLEDDPSLEPVRLQVKMQRRKSHEPWLASRAMTKTRKWPKDHYIVEVQRSRKGEDATGQVTRPYRFGEFDILGVSLGAARGRWRDFTYTVARWLIPDSKSASHILKYQPVAPIETEDWTSSFDKVVEWHRGGVQRTIAG